MRLSSLLIVAWCLLINPVSAAETKPAVAAPPHAVAPLSQEDVRDGWIALFDGQTTFGWTAAKLERVDGKTLLTDGRTTTEFADYKIRVVAIKPGLLLLGDQEVPIRSGEQLIESRGRRGPIVLKDGVRLEALALQPLALRPLFDGKNLHDWDRRGRLTPDGSSRAKWTYADGKLRVVGGPEALEYAPSKSGNLFGDFLAQIVVQSNVADANGGLFIRNEPGKTMMGYEVQLHNRRYDESKGPSGCTTGGIDDRQQARAPVAHDFQPFRVTVVAHGPHLAIWVDGYQTADWADTRPLHANPRLGLRVEPGTIQLQAHDPTTDMEFHGVWLQELPASKP